MTLYDLIAELRREHSGADAARTLDMVVTELGRTRDNLRRALTNLEERPLPSGGKQILEELANRARRADIFDLDYGPPPPLPGELVTEPLDEGQVGIGLLLVGSSVVVMALAVLATVIGIIAAVHAAS
ncbi:MAG TPA: hypothetical protein VJQ84_01455 [Solirubrobacterales bacterium]|nr:hypothetical protein [Solirubrobacterales bacterium]